MHGMIFTDDWRCDQYRWVNQGVKHLPKKMPRVKKSYFYIDSVHGPSADFRRHAYELDPPNNLVLIHYLGDEGAAVDFPHGNQQNESRNFVRTCPSLLGHISAECSRSTTSKVYKSALTNLPPKPHISVLLPRNSKQVENARMKQLRNMRISHDALYNLHELATDMPDFIHVIRTHPDLVCICGQKAMLDELDRAILLKSPTPQLLSYDTTFQLGDFYLSTLSFRHTLFKEAPVIPAAFMIHERKFQSAHTEFLAVCTKLARSLAKAAHPLVTDEEKGIVNAVTSNLPAVCRLRCWNHLLRDVKRWLRGHGATSDDVSVYISNLRELFHQPTMAEYDKLLESMVMKWSAPFRQYYANEIAPDIAAVARWAIEPYRVYDPYSGVTSNQAESFNRVVKQLQEWREAPVDCMVLALHHLQSYYLVEIARGQHNLGDYHLNAQFSPIAETTPLPTSALSPEEIVDRIKGRLAESVQFISSESSQPSNGSSELPSKSLTQLERARLVIEQNRINVDTKLHTFTVLGSARPHVVTLFPKETCSCPSTTTCYHILAAKMSIGLTEKHQPRRQINLTQLRKNARNRREKKSGRKQPRPGDYELVPAPDAILTKGTKDKGEI